MVATRQRSDISFHPILKGAAKLISYIFHPLFIPLYIGLFFIYVLRLFPELDDWNKTKIVLSFFVNYTLLPMVTVLLAKGLGFVDSVFLKTQKDRIIPFVATGVFYFWAWYVFKNNGYPKPVVLFSLAVFLASSAGLIANSYFKVSMHAISAGVVMMLMILMGVNSSSNIGFYISLIFLFCGMVCTSRLITAEHHPFEVYAGLFIGVLAQLISYFFV